MSESIAAESLSRIVEERLTDPEWALVLTQTLRQIRDGFYDAEWVDVIFQEHGRHTLDICDAYVFARLWGAIFSGDILHAKIWVGKTPSADSETEENNASLAALPAPFSARFRGGPGDNDGTFEWTEPIYVAATDGSGITRKRCIEPFSAPLEVGYTRSSVTLLHMNQSLALARWPYGHKWITLLWGFGKWGDRYRVPGT